MGKPTGDLSGAALSLFLFECVHQFDCREEADALVMMLDGMHTYRGGDVGLARAGAANQHDVIGLINEVALVKLSHERLVDLAAGEVKAIEVAVSRKACRFKLIGS